MANLYVSNANRDGSCFVSNQSTWLQARDSAGGTSADNYSSHTSAIRVRRQAGRGGGTLYGVTRSFYHFNTASITSPVSSATLKLHGIGSGDNTASIIGVKSNAFGGDGNSDLVNGDFDSIVGYATGQDLTGNATDYTGRILTTAWNTSGYNDLESTAALRTDMYNDDDVIICVMDYTNDYLNVALTSNVALTYGLVFTEYSSTSADPYIEYELQTMTKVNGVADGDITKVIGTTNSNMAKINNILDTD